MQYRTTANGNTPTGLSYLLYKGKFLRRWDIARTWVFGKTGRGGNKTYISVHIKNILTYTSGQGLGLRGPGSRRLPELFFELCVGVMTDNWLFPQRIRIGNQAKRGFCPQKQPFLSLYQAAPRSGSCPRKSLLPPSIEHASPRSRSSPRKRLLPTSIGQPRAAASGSSPQSSILPPSIEQPRAAAAPPERGSSLPQSGSSAQRELPPKSLLPPSIEQPRAAAAPPETGSSLPQSGSSAQRELPPKSLLPPSI